MEFKATRSVFVAPPDGMADSHPWQLDESPRLYNAARTHLRTNLMQGQDLYEVMRSKMDIILQGEAPGADRRPFICLVDELCGAVSFQDQALTDERSKVDRLEREITFSRDQIDTMETRLSTSKAHIDSLAHQSEKHRAAEKKLQESMTAISNELAATNRELEEARDAERAAKKQAAEATKRMEELLHQRDEDQAKIADDETQLAEYEAQVADLTSQLRRAKSKKIDADKGIDEMQDRVREAERDNVIYMKRIMSLSGKHKEEIAKAHEAHENKMVKMQEDYKNMHAAFSAERERLWDEIRKLLPAESKEKDPMLAGPRTLRREDLLARRVFTTRGKYYFPKPRMVKGGMV
ncbi:hypothetical protein OC844_005186 [Tilletia horrida]|nr:hypothetical protein OC844_005186 [Tilletia horrida]